MNVDYYLLAFDQATDLFFDHLGLGAAHRAATGGSTFAGDIHLTYRRELREGDPLRVTSQLLGFEDRKSVVSGKSVSVRVDLGGRRIINKKKHYIINNNTTLFKHVTNNREQ